MEHQKQIVQICNDLNNIGDRLAPILTERLFDCAVVRVFKSIPDHLAGCSVLAGLGSCLGYYGEWPLHVWGTGFEPGYVDREHRLNPGSRDRWVFHAVRGHITRVWFKLSSDIPVGDPAILTPRIYQPQTFPEAPVRYFTHCDNRQSPAIDAEVIHAEMEPFKAIDVIASTRFVFTEALHVAILAHAYGIPWAWSLNKHSRGIVKWYDWFSSIGIGGQCFGYNELPAARKWYETSRKHWSHIDEDRLVAAFPNQIAI